MALVGLYDLFSGAENPFSFRSSSISTAIAGADVSPGDSMPAAFINPGTGQLIIKSPLSPCALRPVNCVMTFSKGISSKKSDSRYFTVLSPSAVTSSSVFEVLSTEVGPRIIFPSTVLAARTPFPI